MDFQTHSRGKRASFRSDPAFRILNAGFLCARFAAAERGHWPRLRPVNRRLSLLGSNKPSNPRLTIEQHRVISDATDAKAFRTCASPQKSQGHRLKALHT